MNFIKLQSLITFLTCDFLQNVSIDFSTTNLHFIWFTNEIVFIQRKL